MRGAGMWRCVAAISGSLALHGLLAVAVVLYVDHVPEPTAVAELDLSSVELSFSDETAQDAQAVSELPAAAKQEAPAPKSAEPPSEIQPEKRLPPDPLAYRFPEPGEAPPSALSTPPRSASSAQPSSSAPSSRLSQARIDAPPRPRRAIRPEYPKGAQRRGEQGEVVLEISVGADGACVAATVTVSSGFPELDAAAVKAVKAAHFVPAKAGGHPVGSTASLKLVFRLK